MKRLWLRFWAWIHRKRRTRLLPGYTASVAMDPRTRKLVPVVQRLSEDGTVTTLGKHQAKRIKAHFKAAISQARARLDDTGKKV